MPQKLEGEQLLKLREHVLKLLLNNFPNHRSKYIYECADDWCSKQVTSNGIVGYFKAYYGKYEGQEGSKENY
jgi:hypothetical protein|tara:strand:+ start:298 stop:513 length:216 start_codon:yes stop_codon:yes gene_type:complete